MSNVRPGPRNLITDIDGIRVGNAEAVVLCTGTTMVLFDQAVTGAVDIRGGSPATRETDLLSPDCVVDAVDAICFSGGSVYGLAAADGAVGWLSEQGRGFEVGPFRAPIVPAACIFDLGSGGGQKIMVEPPYRALARAACESATDGDFDLGNAGAGLGACAGRIKGGLGSVSALADDGLQVAALVVANPAGAVTLPNSPAMWAWPLEQDGEFGGIRPTGLEQGHDMDLPGESRIGGNTSLALVATNADLSKAGAKRVAIAAHDGLARAIRPVHTPFDGDTIFAVATGTLTRPSELMDLARIGSLAADCVARAAARAVYAAADLGTVPSYRSVYG